MENHADWSAQIGNGPECPASVASTDPTKPESVQRQITYAGRVLMDVVEVEGIQPNRLDKP